MTQKEELIEVVRNVDDVYFDKERYDYLTNEQDLYYRRALMLFCFEAGYSSSGTAKLLDVNQSTIKGYKGDLTEQYAQSVLEAHPKSNPDERLWVDGYENPLGN